MILGVCPTCPPDVVVAGGAQRLGHWEGYGMRSVYRYGQLALFAALILSVWAIAALAQTPAAPAAAAAAAAPAAAPKIDSGDTAWMLTSTALVLMMTIPGLALFYGGMVRKMNVL